MPLGSGPALASIGATALVVLNMAGTDKGRPNECACDLAGFTKEIVAQQNASYRDQNSQYSQKKDRPLPVLSASQA
jgi:hypothetical protein